MLKYNYGIRCFSFIYLASVNSIVSILLRTKLLNKLNFDQILIFSRNNIPNYYVPSTLSIFISKKEADLTSKHRITSINLSNYQQFDKNLHFLDKGDKDTFDYNTEVLSSYCC